MKLRWYYTKYTGGIPILQYFNKKDNEWLNIEEVYDEDYFDHVCDENCKDPCPDK